MSKVAERVAGRYLKKADLIWWSWRSAKEFPTDEALKKYLEDHPKADKDLHWVQDKKRKPTGETDFVQDWSSTRQDAMKEYRTSEFKHEPIKGKMTKEHIGSISKNARGVLKTYAAHLPGDDVDNLHEMIHTQSELLEEALGEGALGEADAEKINLMIMDSVHNLVYQTHESYKRQLGDHGVRHIMGNITTQNDIFDALAKDGKKVPALQRLQALMVMVNHDIGYTAAPATMSPTKYTGEHKKYSDQIFQSEYEDGYQEIFGEEDTEKIKNWIKTHDSDEINWDKDPVGSAVRVADNLALYSKEKLPGLFRLVPGAIDTLEDIAAEAKKAGDAKKKGEKFDDTQMKEIKKKLEQLVNDSKLSAPLKKALLNAAEEVSVMTAKFTLGMLGGQLGDMNFKDGTLHLKVKQNPYDTRLQKMFDLGQRQFGKLAEAYGLDEFKGDEFTFKRGGKTVLEVKLEKADKEDEAEPVKEEKK